MDNDYKWLNKRVERAVNSLHLWHNNPRLDSSENYLYLRDFIEGMISTPSDRKDFLDLVKSIAVRNFQPFDPIVVWKNEIDNKLYVAEGNRRVAALKLLLEPTKAPKAVKATIMRFSQSANLDKLKKIPVAIAPNFESTIWYINQRHVPGSNQKQWSRENHLIWISDLYDTYNKNINQIREFTDATEGQLNKAICVLKLKDKIVELKGRLSKEEYEEATSKRFPISTFERIVDKDFIQEAMGFYFVESELEFSAKNESFLDAFALLIRRLVLPKDNPMRIDSRTHNSVDEIRTLLEKLPVVEKTGVRISSQPKESGIPGISEPPAKLKIKTQSKPLKNDPKRSNLVMDIYILNTDDYRLNELFKELKSLSLNKHPNIAAAAIRVFLDITIKLYIEEKDLIKELQKSAQSNVGFIGLKEKIKFIKEKETINKESKAILARLLDDEYQYSLSVLNGYVHGNKSCDINKEYINRFWDFLFPLFQKTLDIQEKE